MRKPISAYQRGIYFAGNGAYLEFPYSNEQILLLGIQFSIAIWINPSSTDSTLLVYQNSNTETLLSLSLFYLYAELSVQIELHYYNYSSSIELKQNEWNHIMFSLDYNSFTSLQLYINAIPTQSVSISNAPFIDGVNNLAVFGTESLFGENFIGFLYSFELYIVTPDINELVLTSNCDNCIACLPSNECLINCDINEFYNETISQCVECSHNCFSGCRNSDNCNLCIDDNCVSCSNYNMSSCIECASNYELANNMCSLCKSSTFYNSQQQNCEDCPNICKKCSSLTDCFECEINSHLNASTCECDIGYSLNHTFCSRNQFFVLISINKDFVLIIHFTEDLEAELVSSNIEILCNEINQEFSLNKIDNSSYSIAISFVSDISSGDNLTIIFPEELVSIQNSILAKSQINTLISSSYYNSTASHISLAKTAAQATLIVGASAVCGSTLLNHDLSYLFHFLNTLEIYTYTSLFQNNLDPVLTNFLESLSPNPKKPNAFSYLVNEKEQRNIGESKFHYFDFFTSLILLNSGSTLGILTALLIVPTLAVLFGAIKSNRIKKIAKKILDPFKFRVFLRFFLQSFLELGFTATIGIIYNPLDTGIEIIDFIVCLIISVI